MRCCFTIYGERLIEKNLKKLSVSNIIVKEKCFIFPFHTYFMY